MQIIYIWKLLVGAARVAYGRRWKVVMQPVEKTIKE